MWTSSERLRGMGREEGGRSHGSKVEARAMHSQRERVSSGMALLNAYITIGGAIA